MVSKDPENTRQALLFAAFVEINKQGFQAASLGNILKETEVTKGALYHHFPSKLELGYAVVDELIKNSVTEMWISQLEEADNIIDMLLSIIDRHIESRNDDSVCFGCPLNNLAQEMSPIDEGFRERINSLFDLWRNAITEGLLEGQANGIVKESISAETTAYFIVATIEGATSLAKNAKSVDVLKISLQGLREHIQSLRK
jgi:TetR/AcrR family transcriptional regulator, transcriptional repressor for nem operon